ncbi:MAG: phytanoyl-CoA dioxygenase family protein [Chitinophagales bacterium]|nr:phytanoyl-CoA dioxygenase family protein [Chitinophagales bacterium]
MQWLQKYTGFFRRLKPLYVLNNLLHYQQLKHNKALYKQYSIDKSVVSSISAKDFKNSIDDMPWLDQSITTTQQIELKLQNTNFSDEIKQQIIHWKDNGFMIIEQFFNRDLVDRLNNEIEQLIHEKKINTNYTNKKYFNVFNQSNIAKSFIFDERLISILNFILGKEVQLFQSINFIKGSEQKPHSDAVHMSTFPSNYLIAVWIALEDIEFEAGPISYYPKSHLLPNIITEDFTSIHSFLLDDNANEKYEAKIQSLLDKNQIQAKTFLAKKGDIFIWHSKLVHAGLPILHPTLTRKSMVLHFFAKDVICYHEISQRPAIF